MRYPVMPDLIRHLRAFDRIPKEGGSRLKAGMTIALP